MKVAVVYYSLEGNTKKVASQISERLNADLYELKEIKSTVPKTGFFKYVWGRKTGCNEAETGFRRIKY